MGLGGLGMARSCRQHESWVDGPGNSKRFQVASMFLQQGHVYVAAAGRHKRKLRIQSMVLGPAAGCLV